MTCLLRSLSGFNGLASRHRSAHEDDGHECTKIQTIHEGPSDVLRRIRQESPQPLHGGHTSRGQTVITRELRRLSQLAWWRTRSPSRITVEGIGKCEISDKCTLKRCSTSGHRSLREANSECGASREYQNGDPERCDGSPIATSDPCWTPDGVETHETIMAISLPMPLYGDKCVLQFLR